MNDNREPMRVLFVCTHNSARSQMAEGYRRAISDSRFEVMSAGHDRGPVHPVAIRARDRHQRSPLEAVGRGLIRDRWDWVITVCAASFEPCLVFPGLVRRAHWGLPDPAAAGGDEEEKLAVFRNLRGELADRVNAWCAERDREAGAGHAPGDPPDDATAAVRKIHLTCLL